MPSIAVLATWLLSATWLVILGSPALVLTARRFGWLAAIRVGLWFGLAAALLLTLVINFFVPLRSGASVTITVIATALTALAAIALAIAITKYTRNRGPFITPAPRGPFPYWSLILIAALFLVLVATAHATFGAPNQWDAGLYHLNAIQYASEYRVIPGLVNLHDRFGVTNSQHLLTALLSNTGWGLDAFRLQVGFFVFLLSADISLRLLDTRKTTASTGTLILLLGSLGLLPFLLGNPDELITSPSPDSVAVIVTLVGAAYLADGLTTRRSQWAATGLLVLAAAASIRTQLWAFAGIALIVTFVYFQRTKATQKKKNDAPTTRRPRALTLLAATTSGGLLIATQTRDAIQTGWLLFPLDLFPLPVDWKAFDPAASRTWIVSWARTPGSSPEEVLGNYSWVGGWVARSLADWGVGLALGLLALAATIALVTRGLRASNPASDPRPADKNPAAALWLLIPVLIAIILWFLSAPDPRFAWGPIVLLGAIPAAVALQRFLTSKATPITAAIAALAIFPAGALALTAINGTQEEGESVVTFTGVPWTVSAALQPVPSPDLAVYTLPTGQELITPTADDRCWTAFPLCRPYPNDSLIFRGDSIQDGFASRLWQD